MLEKYAPFCWAIRPNDPPEVIYTKKAIVAFSLASIVFNGLVLLVRQTNGSGGGFLSHASTYPLFAGALLGLQVFEGKYRPLVFEAALYLTTLGILLTDYLRASLSLPGVWAFTIIIIDICLVCRLERRVARNIVLATLFWLILQYAESWLRFGIYDAWYLPSQQERLDVSKKMFNCTSLPCNTNAGTALMGMLSCSTLFLLDFYITRGFADRLFEQHDNMQEAINTAEHMGNSLARFDLAEAKSTIMSLLNQPIYEAFGKILTNLHSYRPYLPAALTGVVEGAVAPDMGLDAVMVPMPKLEEPVVGLVEARRSPLLRGKESALKEPLMGSMSLQPSSELRTVASASVCKVDVKLHTDSRLRVARVLNELLTKVMLCGERTHGVVISLQGSRVALGWNASRPCPAHVENAFAFVSMLHHSYGGLVDEVHLGLSSSVAHHGTLGSGSQRFVAVVGGCLSVSDALCTMGMHKRAFCLYGSPALACSVPGMDSELLEEAVIPGHEETRVHIVAMSSDMSSSMWWGPIGQQGHPLASSSSLPPAGMQE